MNKNNSVCRYVLAKKAVKLASIALVLWGLTACVTTESGIFSVNKSEEKALESRVQIALRYLSDEKDTDMAIKHLKMALEIDSKSPRVHEVLGIAFQQAGELELAEQHFQKALKYDPNYSRGRNNYAAFLYAQGQYADAKKQLERVVKDVYYENRAAAFSNLGLNYLKLGDIEQAKQAFVRGLSMDTSQTLPKLELADICYQQGDYASAQSYFDLYKSGVSQASPRSLLLGIQIATQFEDKDAIASYSMVLKNLYPKSKEFLELKTWQTQ